MTCDAGQLMKIAGSNFSESCHSNLPSLNLDVDASSLNGVVEVLGQKCQGQNLCDCLNMPPVTLCNSLAITRNIAQPAKGSQVIDLYGDFETLV